MKKFLTWFSLGCVLVCGIYASIAMGKLPATYDAQNATVPVYELQQNPEAYDDSTADGAAAAIVQQNLAKSHAVNDVSSIVFDFRGYDTMGESFIMITAVCGTLVILYRKRAKKEDEGGETK